MEHKAAILYSQYGEDGLIAETLERIGEQSRRCFEVGAGDGESLSNTKALRDKGWSAILVEEADNHQQKLLAYESKLVRVIHQKITPRNVNDLFTGAFDVGSLDIDGQDYHVFEAMLCRPRIMLVEYFAHGVDDRKSIPALGQPGQATLTPIKELGESKGYTLIAATHCNCLFFNDN